MSLRQARSMAVPLALLATILVAAPAAAAPAVSVEVSPRRLTFPTTTVGSWSEYERLTFTNNTGQTVYLTGATPGGPDIASFGSYATDDLADCFGANYVLTPGETCFVLVAFRPMRTGQHRAWVTMHFGLSPADPANSGAFATTVVLRGRGT